MTSTTTLADDPAPSPVPSVPDSVPAKPTPELRTVGGVILPSKTWVPFVAGAIGGMSGAVLTAPLDVVKTRLQSDFYKERLHTVKAVGTAQSRFGVLKHLVETGVILRDVYRFEGLRALFKGLGPTLSGVVPARAINIYTYSNTRRLLEHNVPTLTLTQLVFLSAILAGLVTSTATNPIWVVKTRLQLDKSSTGPIPLSLSNSRFSYLKLLILASRRYKNSLNCVSQIWRQEGVKGFSRGLSASYLGVTESTLQWVMYERLKRVFRTEEKKGTVVNRGYKEKLGEALGAGFFAKLIATVVTYPHEVARTRLRQAPSLTGDMQRKYNGLFRCFVTVFREEGVAGLYGGLTPHLMKSVPAAMVYFTVYEGMLGWAGIET